MGNIKIYWELKEKVKDRKYENDSLSHEHKEEIEVTFEKSIDFVTSILSNNNNNHNNEKEIYQKFSYLPF